MRLSFLISDIRVILEGYGRVNKIRYANWRTDPIPNVLILGTFTHPTTRNRLLAGINLNYLTDQQIDTLRYYLPEILKDKNLYVRYWTGVRLFPEVFRSFYRYYNVDKITSKTGATLKFLTPKELEQTGDIERAGKLAKRREQLKAVQARTQRIIPAQRPVIEPAIPPEAVSELPPEEQETAERAKQAVDRQLASKLARKIDDRTKELLPPEAPEEPEILEPEELKEPLPEEPKEPEEESEENPEEVKPDVAKRAEQAVERGLSEKELSDDVKKLLRSFGFEV